ncbi:diguanylate cyclase [Rheinheimera muenzenbergensis]|uniref:diguanylate cyclase n=1 Tax=Rheinheimera muenzenbergensis TaxID=1193628 RepID=A0ABU8CBP2_9GAMM
MRLFTLLLLCVSFTAFADARLQARQALETEFETALPERQIAILRQLVDDNIKQDPSYALKQAMLLIARLDETAPDSVSYLDALRIVATLQVGQGQLAAAQQNAQKLAAGAEKLAEHNQHIQALKILGVITRIHSDYEGALQYFHRATALAQQHHMPDAAMQIDYEIAIIYYYMGKYAEAIELLKRIQPKAEQANNQLLTGKVLNILGIVYANQSRFEESLEVMLTALEIQKARGNKGAQQALLNNIGVTYNRIGKIKQALDIYLESLDLAVELNDVHSEALALLNIAAIQQDLAENDAALTNLSRGLAIAKRLNDKNLIAQGLNSSAEYYLAKADFARVIELSTEALALADSSGDKTTAVKPRQNLAKAYFGQGNLSTALDYIGQAINIASALENKSTLANLYKLQADIYQQSGDYAMALSAHRRYSELHNAVFNEESDKKLAALSAKNESLQKDRKIEALASEQQVQAIRHEQELALRDQVANQADFQRNVGAALLALLLCVLFMFYRRRLQTRLNKKLSQQVKDRTRELAAKNLELERAYAVLETQSLTDQLTQLHNRRFLMQKLPEDLATTPANLKEQDFVFLLLDLDNFKQVNDNYGHTAGDLVLIQFSELMKHVFRASDYTIRWGGEEFLVVMRHMNRDNAAVYAERLRRTVEQHNFVVNDDTSINMTCSIGFACFPDSRGESPVLSWHQIIDVADICLYAAKKSQKNAWVGVDSLAAHTGFKDLIDDMSLSVAANQVKIVSSIAADNIIWH